MPRKKTQISTELPYHINARCINRDWFKMDMRDVWSIMENQLYFLHHAFEVKIHCFVLMTNHYHLIATFPKNNMSSAMEIFMKESSRNITKDSCRINQTWGSRFHRCLISSYHYYMNAYKYVHQNPVAAGLANSVVDYPFSTLRGALGFSPLYIPIAEDPLLFEGDLLQHLKWLDDQPAQENFDAVRKALRRSEFKLPKRNCKPNPLEMELP